ncbi:lipopolysaccharide biosynthesis protein [Enterococcus xiangfangensis]|uniref:Uncharacterized protein n=3 Tax=Enterococcus xiangfangensis TaxID=1296537 RepID=A0ABU3FA96_9ENTE|nr:hypothetical protein [Enterococcus xiangfangensis]MDT2759584.1 hypothetical protein [Enterococcus xiangfangensis]
MKKAFMKNLSFSFISNIVVLLTSALSIFILPKFMAVEEFGLYQLYLLYFSYSGLLQLGWADGIFLKYGGLQYDDIDKREIKSHFIYSLIYSALISATVAVFLILYRSFDLRNLILIVSIVITVVTTPRGILYYILQGTGRMKEYSASVILGRLFFLLSIIGLVITHKTDFILLILCELLSQLLALMLSMYNMRDIFKVRILGLREFAPSIRTSINIGFKLLVANIASQLMLGQNRFAIESHWGIKVFSEVSLTLSISNLVLIFMNSASIVVFPFLKRIGIEKMRSIFFYISNAISVFSSLTLILYYPLVMIIALWLPQYENSIQFMGILFPIIIFEGKNSILLLTYLKALRKEKFIMLSNIISVLFSLFLVVISIYVFDSLKIMLIFIVVSLGFRMYFNEFFLSRFLSVKMTRNVKRGILLEILLVATFIVMNLIAVSELYKLGVIVALILIFVLVNKADLRKVYEEIFLK